jgi:hypothetical protein
MLGPIRISTLDAQKFDFLARCIAAIKKQRVRAEASGGFSICVGNDRHRELQLDEYWQLYTESQDAGVIDQVAAEARRMVG